MRRSTDYLLASLGTATLATAAVLQPGAGAVRLPGVGAVPLVCLFRRLTGIDCAFCGMTRSAIALLDGDLAASLAFHPAGPVAVLAIGATVVAALALAALDRPPLSGRRGFGRALVGIFGFCVLAGTARLLLG